MCIIVFSLLIKTAILLLDGLVLIIIFAYILFLLDVIFSNLDII